MNDLPLTENSDFHYLLELMVPLNRCKEFAWLPELLTIVGYQALIDLCRYAGGETIKIPTIDELSQNISAFQWFYDIYIKHSKKLSDVPGDLAPKVNLIAGEYDARDSYSIHR